MASTLSSGEGDAKLPLTPELRIQVQTRARVWSLDSGPGYIRLCRKLGYGWKRHRVGLG